MFNPGVMQHFRLLFLQPMKTPDVGMRDCFKVSAYWSSMDLQHCFSFSRWEVG